MKKNNLVVFNNNNPINEAEELLSRFDEIYGMEDGDEKDFKNLALRTDILRYRVRKNPRFRKKYNQPAVIER